MLPTKELKPGNGGDTERKKGRRRKKKGHFIVQNHSSVSEIVSVMSLYHLAEATKCCRLLKKRPGTKILVK